MAFPLLHERMMRHRDDGEQLKLNAWLGMPGAQAKLDASRREAVAGLDFEVG